MQNEWVQRENYSMDEAETEDSIRVECMCDASKETHAETRLEFVQFYIF